MHHNFFTCDAPPVTKSTNLNDVECILSTVNSISGSMEGVGVLKDAKGASCWCLYPVPRSTWPACLADRGLTCPNTFLLKLITPALGRALPDNAKAIICPVESSV